MNDCSPWIFHYARPPRNNGNEKTYRRWTIIIIYTMIITMRDFGKIIITITMIIRRANENICLVARLVMQCSINPMCPKFVCTGVCVHVHSAKPYLLTWNYSWAIDTSRLVIYICARTLGLCTVFVGNGSLVRLQLACAFALK